MDSHPLVSVIVPAYNAAPFLPEAVASIRRQRYAPLEIVVVDDGSTDGTAGTVAALGDDIVYVHQENAGPAAARNRGIGVARAALIAFLDADDLWPDGKLHLQVARLAECPDLAVVTGRVQYVDLPGADALDIPFEGRDRTIASTHLGAAVCRRRVFDEVGLFEETMRFGEDQDWFLRVKESNLRMSILPEVTLVYRRHGQSMTRDRQGMQRALPGLLKRSLDRRRTAGGPIRPYSPWLSADEGRQEPR